MVFSTGCAGCGCVELGCQLCALCEGSCSTSRTGTFTHNYSQHNQCRTPYTVIHNLVLLKMSIMMLETWWDRCLVINTRLVASCWFFSPHPTFMIHGHKNLKHVYLLALLVLAGWLVNELNLLNYTCTKKGNEHATYLLLLWIGIQWLRYTLYVNLTSPNSHRSVWTSCIWLCMPACTSCKHKQTAVLVAVSSAPVCVLL